MGLAHSLDRNTKEEEFFMANRVVISICGEEYTFVAEESASYMQKVGAYVSDKMAEVLGSATPCTAVRIPSSTWNVTPAWITGRPLKY